jgi:hypothetical protein
MYTVQIGKKFLELYNQKMGTDLTPMQFFDQVYWPLFFNSEDKKHLIEAHNSWFSQPGIKSKYNSIEELAIARRDKFIDKIHATSDGKDLVDGSVAIGFMAYGNDANTSGQVTDIKVQLSTNEILYSWFGAALGVHCAYRLSLLLDNEEINWFLFQGWEYYRKYVNKSSIIEKGRQIETWNCIWLTYGFDHKENLDDAFDKVRFRLSDKQNNLIKEGKLSCPNWSDLMIALSKSKITTPKVFAMGCHFAKNPSDYMNRTYGFFMMNLPEIKKTIDFYDRLLVRSGENPKAENAFETVFKAQYSMERAIQTGGIGLRAFTPKDLYKYLGGKPDLPKTDKNNLYTFYIYLSWLKAMLNNDATLALAEKLAITLKEFADYTDPNAKAGKTDRFRKVENLWEAKSRNQFINGLDELLQDKQPANPDVLNEIVQAVMLHIPSDQFTLFQTLVKFQFHYLKTKN